MSDKFVFQNARIKHMELKLLTSAHVQRLLECGSAADAYKFLTELGFGGGSSENGNFDAMFEREEQNAAAVLRSFNADGVLDPFLIENDYHNLKAYLKAAVSGSDSAALLPDGLIGHDKIKASLFGDASDLPPEMAEALKTVEKLISEEKVSPSKIDTVVDVAKFKNVFRLIKKGSELMKRYYAAKADYININSFLRANKLGLSEKFFTNAFIDGGALGADTFTGIYEASPDAFKEKCKFTPYQDFASMAAEGASLVSLEVVADDALLKMWKDEKDDMFSEAPVAAYYLTKLAELKVVKLIVAGLKNHVEPALIKERMRNLYA